MLLAPSSRATRAPWWGLGIAVLLVGAAVVVPPLWHWHVHASLHPVRPFAPLAGYVEPRVGIGTPVAVLLAVLGVWWAARLARRLSWGALLVATYAGCLAWTLALAFVDGTSGLTHEIDNRNEYLPTAWRVHGIHSLLEGFTSRIPVGVPGSWPTHVAGHPPGALLLFVGLVRAGLGRELPAALAITVVGTTTPVAVLVALRRLGAEPLARTCAPFLVLAPAAVWVAVSADAVFAAVAAWGLVCTAYAATSRGRATVLWGLAGGLLLGSCLLLSYGLPLLAPLVLAVLTVARRWSALPWLAIGAVTPVLAFAAEGFRLWSAYPVLNDRYWAGIAAGRPASYWFWGDLAALTISAGPALVIGVASLVAAGRSADRTARLLVGAAGAAIVLADLSRMSKAEVERIWLPFIPWLLLSTAALPPRWRRPALALQVLVALAVQHLVITNW